MDDRTYLSLHRPPWRWTRVQAYKHDGSFHRQWSPAFLTYECPEFWALCSRNSLVTEGDGRKWITRENAVFYLFRRRWFNVLSMRKEEGIVHYVNIASPTIKDGGFLRYIDYDLDVKLYPDGGIRLLDGKEFDVHVRQFNYPSWVVEKCQSAVQEIEEMMKAGEPPFSKEFCDKMFAEFDRMTKDS